MHQFYHFVCAETTPSEATDPVRSFYICSKDYHIQLRASDPNDCPLSRCRRFLL